MSIYRTYFRKNNTIIRDQVANTAKNPATEIKYGSVFTKFLFQLDIDKLKAKVNAGDIPLAAKHYLHLTNCIFGDEDLAGEYDIATQRASSFDLIIFKVKEAWDEGVGYEYTHEPYGDHRHRLYSETASNWEFRTTGTPWSEPGVYTTNLTGGTTADIVSIQHFDNGNENLHVDITTYINDVLTGATEHHGLGIAFAPLYETLAEQNYDQAVSFFTKYTQTFHEPYLETIWDDRVEDNRVDFVLGISQNLAIYVTQNGLLTDLDTTPTVDLLDFDKLPLVNYTGLTTTKVSKGTYVLSVNLTGLTLCENKIYLYDVWKGLSIGGKDLKNQTLRFVPRELEEGIGFSGKVSTKKYVPFVYGLAMDERIVRGERRKVIVECKELMGGKRLLNEVYYRIYVREGMTEVDVVEWTQLNKTDVENNFFLDTEFLIPKEYFMDVKIQENNEISILKQQIKFHIVNQK